MPNVFLQCEVTADEPEKTSTKARRRGIACKMLNNSRSAPAITLALWAQEARAGTPEDINDSAVEVAQPIAYSSTSVGVAAAGAHSRAHRITQTLK
eukprot:4430259-Pyramimonas_sp.AAC.1